jgi:formylglycine-generating enzyme required for sulfatase activity
VTGNARHPLKGGRSPAWATAWGEDRYGAFAIFAVGPREKPVVQRMRWILPGRFLMGSPSTELMRSEREGPQHWVTITKGYWFGETPVTQALWVAVMGNNPSHFRGEQPDSLERPVEKVSWDDCEMFIARLNKQVARLAAALPTEAQWERACRGETTGVTWVHELSGSAQTPELDAIAWYGANSGNKTHPVGRKAPNPYGVHDILGSVYEWCQDVARDAGMPHRYASDPVTDPMTHGEGSYRVNRGGSWDSSAVDVRTARRHVNARGDRFGNLGFRLAAELAAE